MATKPSQPALYEKMRTRGGPASPVTTKVDVHPTTPASSGESGGSWLSPGRTVRLPTGFILLACGIAVLLLSIAYMLGHRRGIAVARADFDQRVIESASGTVEDPLRSLQPVMNTPSGPRSTPNTVNPPRTEGGSAVKSNPPSSWGPVVPSKDPRQKGFNYFILAETHEQGAKALAEFCRKEGLETYVVSGKNGLRRVIAFPGFERSARNSQQVNALEAQIKAIGLKWKNVKGYGGDDLHGTYPSLYNG